MHGRMNVKTVLLLKLEALERKHFYVCHKQGGCDWKCQRKDLNISGYEPHEGLNSKTDRLTATCEVSWILIWSGALKRSNIYLFIKSAINLNG